jgi:hypothetical protein
MPNWFAGEIAGIKEVARTTIRESTNHGRFLEGPSTRIRMRMLITIANRIYDFECTNNGMPVSCVLAKHMTREKRAPVPSGNGLLNTPGCRNPLLIARLARIN